MKYKQFSDILNRVIFTENKKKLIENIAKYPDRYIGLFRATKPSTKILQNLLQSQEIRFGDAFEEIIEKYFLDDFGYKSLDKNILTEEGENLALDQYFEDESKVYFIEQKIRDDHDSTKKRGQLENFKKKLDILVNKHKSKPITGIFYFIDPALKKNNAYYRIELEKLNQNYSNISLHLCYGGELFILFHKEKYWEEILQHLEQWKEEIPEVPNINFDLDSVTSFNEIKDLSPTLYAKIFSNDRIYNSIVLTIFPEKETLKLLLEHFKTKAKSQSKYIEVAKLLETKLSN